MVSWTGTGITSYPGVFLREHVEKHQNTRTTQLYPFTLGRLRTLRKGKVHPCLRSPTFNHARSPAFNHVHSWSPALNHECSLSPAFNHARSLVFNYARSPTFNHARSLVFNHARSPVFNHARSWWPAFNHACSWSPAFTSSPTFTYNIHLQTTCVHLRSTTFTYVYPTQMLLALTPSSPLRGWRKSKRPRTVWESGCSEPHQANICWKNLWSQGTRLGEMGIQICNTIQ